MSLRHWSGFTSSPMTSVCIRYPSPVPCHAFPFPVDKSLCLSIWSIKCCKFCDEGQSIKFLEHVCASYRGAASMLLTVFDSYWRKIDDLNPPHIRAPLLTSLVLGHPPFFFMPSHSIYQTCFQQSKARKSLSFLRKIFCVILSRCRANKKKKRKKKRKANKKGGHSAETAAWHQLPSHVNGGLQPRWQQTIHGKRKLPHMLKELWIKSPFSLHQCSVLKCTQSALAHGKLLGEEALKCLS